MSLAARRLPSLLPSRFLRRQFPRVIASFCTQSVNHPARSNNATTASRTSSSRSSINYSQLYNSLVNDPLPQSLVNAIAIAEDATLLPEPQQNALKGRLDRARANASVKEAMALLRDIDASRWQVTTKTLLSIMGICVSVKDFATATSVLSRLETLPPQNPTKSPRMLVTARRKLAIAYSLRRDFVTALRIMGIPTALIHAPVDEIRRVVMQLEPREDALAWGVMAKSFTKLKRPDVGLALLDMACENGVPMSDSLLHLTIDALRMQNDWRRAHQLFQTFMSRGLQPSEITVASMLLAYANKNGREQVARAFVEQAVDSVGEPSIRFVATAFKALCAVGSVQRAERFFEELQHCREDFPTYDHLVHMLFTCYGNYLSRLTAEEIEALGARLYSETAEKVDSLWVQYVQKYGKSLPTDSANPAYILGKYLVVKTRCFEVRDCTELLEAISEDREQFSTVHLDIANVSTVLGSVEHLCDVDQMDRLLRLMEHHGLQHDMRSLAFVIGTLIGDGNLSRAVDMVEEHTENALSVADDSYIWRKHFPVLLERRLVTLKQALIDSGNTSAVGLDDWIEAVSARRQKR